MRPIQSSSPHSATPVRGHPMHYGAHGPAAYPYSHYAMPPHSHMPPSGVPPPPPGYALVPVGDRHNVARHGNPVSPDAQGSPHSKHHQYNHRGGQPYVHDTPGSASRNRTPRSNMKTPTRNVKQGSPLTFNPSTSTPSQRVPHPPALREPHYSPSGKFISKL